MPVLESSNTIYCLFVVEKFLMVLTEQSGHRKFGMAGFNGFSVFVGLSDWVRHCFVLLTIST